VDTPLAELAQADSAFLSSTLREVQPIATVDGEVLREVGCEITVKLRQAFSELAKDQVDP
jgi:branched-chain amino acid aminotransferase